MILRSLQQLAPLLLRHLGAYAELAKQDLAIFQERLAAKLRAMVIFGFSALIALVMICTFVVAATWDTPNRMLAIGLMAALFVLLTLGSGVYLFKQQLPQFLGSVRREWSHDRSILQGSIIDAD
ncbi:MAG: hypothetical protein H7Y02_09570 [Candidatus Obscuribacterales bacterium]|nr:hypothetical protein [Steroidobacteraceae bacterium]